MTMLYNKLFSILYTSVLVLMRGTYTHVLVLIGAVMVSMLASSAGRVKPKTEIGICCVSAKHAALKTGWLGISESG
jgi:hypothetical protein